MPNNLFLTNLQHFEFSQFSSNAHIDNSAYFVKSSSPRAFSIFI